jgi:glycerate dehydrogenase
MASRPQIVVLDGYTLNPGDLSWDPLLALGDCQIHERTLAAQVVPRAKAATVLLTNKTVLAREQLSQLPSLKYISVLATGYNIVDIVAAREQQVVVSNVPAYGTASVAQLTFALVLELTHRAGDHSASTHRGDWARAADWCYWNFPLVELEGLTLGVIGLGRIGQAVARLGQAFGMKVLAATPHPKDLAGITQLPIPDLLGASDVVTLHCPLTPETRQLINEQTLARMKPTAFLINTSRGALIDEPALARALAAGQIAGAGLDVLSAEPPPADHPLLSAPNCIVTPHLAWATKAARTRLLKVTVENVKAFLSGRPQNVVNA